MFKALSEGLLGYQCAIIYFIGVVDKLGFSEERIDWNVINVDTVLVIS